MDYVLSKKYDETFTINFIGTETLSYSTGDTSNRLHLTIDDPINGVSKIDRIEYRVDGVIDSTQYLKIYFKYKNAVNDDIPCDGCWSDKLEIQFLSGLTLNSNYPFDIELFFYRVDDPKDGQSPTDIWVSNIIIYGEYEMDKTDGMVTITDDNNQIILQPSDTYKVFSVSDFNVIVSGNVGNIDIKYRVTQNEGRTYSEWEPLTKENISTFRFNELRFAKVEYLIEQLYPSSTPTIIYDVILEGDFQNVSANYLKTNRYGLREDCLTSYYNGPGASFCAGSYGAPNIPGIISTSSSNTGDYDLKMNFYTQGLSCYIHSTSLNEINLENNDNQGDMWNPYETGKITDLYNSLANQVNNIFAWKVDYHLTDPDEGGTDMVLHEYQLYNITMVKTIKILVPDNKFPDNTIQMNNFNLDLFDTFEIHILKDEFKNNFGIDKRPGENDIIFFCELNRLYRIKHSQVFREIMNAGIYYKVILEKYEQKANIRNLSQESKSKLDILTKDTTLDELFGIEETEEREKIANRDQTKPITHGTMRDSVHKDVIITKQEIYNGSINFINSYYNFTDVIGKRAITYKKYDRILNKSENRSIIAWVNFNNKYNDENHRSDEYKYYSINNTKNFNIINNFNETTKKGYRMWYNKNKIIFQLNDIIYNLGVSLKTNIWYGVLVNLDQRQREINIRVYKRDGNYNIKMLNPDTYELATVHSLDLTGQTYLNTIGFKPINNEEVGVNTGSEVFVNAHSKQYKNVIPVEFNHNNVIEIMGSDIKYSNLRIFNDVIPEGSINNVLNQYIITDEHRLIVSDNADRELFVDTTFPTDRWV